MGLRAGLPLGSDSWEEFGGRDRRETLIIKVKNEMDKEQVVRCWLPRLPPIFIL